MTIVYQNQNSLTLQLDTGVDLTSCLSIVIKYINPNGVQGQWTATASTTKAVYNFSGTELSVTGVWTCWVHAVFADTRTADGDPIQFYVQTPGTMP